MVPLLAAAGSVTGAALTFWLGIKIGEQGLERFLPPKRLEKIRKRIKESGAVEGCIVIAAVLTILSVVRIIRLTRPVHPDAPAMDRA